MSGCFESQVEISRDWDQEVSFLSQSVFTVSWVFWVVSICGTLFWTGVFSSEAAVFDTFGVT